MAVQEQTPYIEYTANGVVTGFALGFNCESKDHLIVTLDGMEPPVGSWSLIDGAVVFTTAPTNGALVVIQRNTPFSRTTDYQSYNDSFRPPAINNDFDRVWWKIQELGVRDWLLDLKIQKFRDDVNLTALENTLEEARQIRDDTADSVAEVQSNVAQSQSLLADTTTQANLAQGYASSANSANAAAQQAVIDVSSAEANVYSALSAQQIAVNNSLTAIAGGHKAYQTLALAQAAQASLPANTIVEVTNDGANNGTYQWNGTTLTKSAYDPLSQSKLYADTLISSSLSTTTDLNTLEAGNYYLLSSNLNALVDAGNFTALGYPVDTVKGGGVKLNVVRKGSYTYQTLEFSAQGRILTRQGQIGAGFTAWISGARDAMKYTDNELNKKFGSIVAGTSLNTFINAGTWGISGFTASVDSRVPAMGYPETLSESSAVLTVAQTASGYAVQELTHGVKKYKRILNRATGAIYEDWQVLTGITDYVKKGFVATAESLNSYTTEGVYAISTTVLRAGLESGSLSFPNFFTATGGAILIVARVGNYHYQTVIGTYQQKIATRQGDGSSWLPWVNTLNIVPDVKKTFLCYGSSSFEYMATKMRAMIESFSATYVSDAISGQILETMQAHQGSNPISIVFNDGVTALNNVASAVTVTQIDDIGSLAANGSFTVTLSNGLKGTLNLNANTFTASNATEIYNVDSLSFDVDFGFFDYAQTAYHIFNIGKNNITMGYYTTQQVLDETNKMIDFIKNKGNQNFIVAGHFVDNGMVAGRKQVVLDVNAALKAKYGEKYFDMQDYLMSAQIWADLNITPTQDDLDKQAAGELAVSLGRDFNHLSAAVDTLMVARLKQKLQDVGYL